MIPVRRAETMEELLQALDDRKQRVCPIAGGTDVVPGLRGNLRRFADYTRLIDISSLSPLKGISVDGDFLKIGSASTFTDIVNNEEVRQQAPLLTEACSRIGSEQIRNRATIGGNVVNNAPCADSIPALLVYDAQLVVRSIETERRVKLDDFLLSPYRVNKSDNEVVTAFCLPLLKSNMEGFYYKLSRRMGASISRITLALLMETDSDLISEFRFATGAVTAVATRLPQIEEQALHRPCTREEFIFLAQSLGQCIEEMTGHRWSSAYKLPVIQQLFFQMLQNTYLNIIRGK